MYLIKLIWYILKMIVAAILGIFYFLIASIIRPLNLWSAKRVFVSYVNLFISFIGLNISYNFINQKTRNAENTVFVMLNQFSFLDPLVTTPLPIPKLRAIMNIEFAFYPIFGWFLAIANFVIVRQWPSQAKSTINRTNEFLRGGGNMIISIEGKRTKNGKLNPYKKGPVVMAINNQSDIVPIIIEGTYESLPYKSFYPKPGDIKVKLLEPISTKGLKYEDRDSMMDRLLSIAHTNGLE